mgnify:CR=1 FL=1
MIGGMFWDFAWRLLLAGVLGAVLGIHREDRAKEAGFRTHFLVALGSALFMIVSQYGFSGVLAGADVKLDTLSDYKTMIELAAKQGYVHEDELQTLQQWRRDPANWKKSAQ